MPTKNLIKKRELARKWYQNNKQKVLDYHKIVKAPQKAHPIPKKCQIEGCKNTGQRHHPDYSKPTEIEWICGTHHRKIKHTSKCKVCGDKVRGLELCTKHYFKHKRKSPEWLEKHRKWMRDYKKKRKLMKK